MQGFGFTISVLLGFTAFGFRGAGLRGLRFRCFSALGFRGAGFRVLGFLACRLYI